MNEEELFESHYHIAKQTLYRMFPSPHAICRQHRIEMDDLLQYARTGLWKGALSFDENKNTKFMSHAINHIKWHVCERLKRETSIIKYDSNKFNEIAQFGILSIDVEPDSDSYDHSTYHDIIPNSDIDIESNVMGNSERNQILSQLNDKQKEIVKLIEKGLNTNDIARLWNMTGSNVRWHYNKAKKIIEEYQLEVV